MAACPVLSRSLQKYMFKIQANKEILHLIVSSLREKTGQLVSKCAWERATCSVYHERPEKHLTLFTHVIEPFPQMPKYAFKPTRYTRCGLRGCKPPHSQNILKKIHHVDLGMCVFCQPEMWDKIDWMYPILSWFSSIYTHKE